MTPDVLTETMAGLLELQVVGGGVTPASTFTLAISGSDSPIAMVAVDTFTVIEETPMTVNGIFTDRLVDVGRTVIVPAPRATAVTVPELSTDAMAVFEDVH
jgi:hypothetical protein